MSSSKTKGIYIPTSQIWDINEIKDTDASESLKELLIRMYQNLGNMATAINSKESAIYDTSEFVTGGVYFPNVNLTSQTVQTPRQRQIVRTIVVFPSLPNIMTANKIAHNIPFNSGYTVTAINGVAMDKTNLLYYPLSFAAAAGKIFSLWVDGTYVYIDTNSFDLHLYSVIVVIEYLKF